jgi:hypothetical protein
MMYSPTAPREKIIQLQWTVDSIVEFERGRL